MPWSVNVNVVWALLSIELLLLFSTFELSHFWGVDITANAYVRENIYFGA